MLDNQKKYFTIILAVSVFLLTAVVKTAFAYPALQLDIMDGWYDTSTETIVSSGSSFTLYALFNTNKKLDPTETYYISAAIAPGLAEGVDLDNSSFTIDGVTTDVTEDMTYGSAPIDAVYQDHDGGDLPQHGMFPTYFIEVPFTFDPDNKTSAYNTQDNPGGFSGDNPDGEFLYATFEVDVSGLDPELSGYVLHFDLYNTDVFINSHVDIDAGDFAPFSKDASSGGPIPEPATMLLLGSGLGLIGFTKRHRNKR